MNQIDLKAIELEITSLCNLACGLCHRTNNLGSFEIASISINDIKRMFPVRETIENKFFLLCGALGEPVSNKDCYLIAEYLGSNGGYVEINSNASLETSDWWYRLGKLSSDTNQLSVWFCVDGYKETNHIYRINSNFDIIIRNMEAYVEGGKEGNKGSATATWMYNLFDHNIKELDLAKDHAEKLGIKFATRRSVGNSFGFVAKKRVRNKETREVHENNVSFKSSGDSAHSGSDTHALLIRLTDGRQ